MRFFGFLQLANFCFTFFHSQKVQDLEQFVLITFFGCNILYRYMLFLSVSRINIELIVSSVGFSFSNGIIISCKYSFPVKSTFLSMLSPISLIEISNFKLMERILKVVAFFGSAYFREKTISPVVCSFIEKRTPFLEFLSLYIIKRLGNLSLSNDQLSKQRKVYRAPRSSKIWDP